MRFWLGAVWVLAVLLLSGCMGGPSSAAAKQVAGGIELSWTPAEGAAGYAVYRGTEPGSEGIRINAKLIVGETRYTDTSLINGQAYYYTVKAVDAGGKEYGGAKASATARITPPQNIAITINGGTNYTSSRDAALLLSASGAKDCRLSNDGQAWSDWEAYTAQRQWALSEGDGPKNVYYQCRDEIGNTAPPVTATIYLDTVAPEITITSPAAGGQYSGSFELAFMVADPVSKTVSCAGRLDNNPVEIGAVDAGAAHSITIYAAAGTRTLYMECSDGVLKGAKSVTFSMVDKPDISVVAGDGSGYTSSQTISAHIAARLAQDCRLSNDGAAWGNWFPYTQNQQWTLTSGDGTKSVYAQCRGASGVLSDLAHDTIVLDTSPPPYIHVAINNGERWTNVRDVKLGLYAFAADQCRYSNDGIGWSAWERYSAYKAWTLPADRGRHTVYYSCKKRNGDDVGTATADIIYSPVPPDPPADLSIRINDGDEYTMSTHVRLRIYADNAYACRVRQDSYDWNEWTDYDRELAFVLRGGDGLKTIYLQCRNDYGTRTVHDAIYLATSPPERITDLRAEPSGGAAYLSWSRPSGAVTSYAVYRSNTEFGLFTPLGNTATVSFVDGTGLPGETYAYTVKARDVAGQVSPDSNVASVTIPPG